MDTERRCEGCGEVLVGPGRSDRRYHGPACRKAGYKRRQHEAKTANANAVADSSSPGFPPEGVGTLSVPTGQPLDPQAVIAQATAEPRLLALLARAAQTNWRAAAWLLERQFPQRWSGKGEPERPVLDPDPFLEVDQLAARRRRRDT